MRSRASPACRWALWVALGLFLGFLLLPGPRESAFGGVPLSSPSFLLAASVFVLAVFVGFFPPERSPGLWPLACLSVLICAKLLTGWLAVPIGWHGVYFADGDPAGRVSFSAGLTLQPFRIDRQIEFAGAKFGLYFINDPLRYAGTWSPQRRDIEHPLTVEWTAYFSLEAPRTVDLVLAGRGRLKVVVDGQSGFDGQPDETPQGIEAQLGSGPHVVRVRYEKPAAVEPLIRFAVRADGRDLNVTPLPQAPPAVDRSLKLGTAMNVLTVAMALVLALTLLRSYWPPTGLLMRLIRQPDRTAVVAVFAAILLAGVLRSVIPVRHATVSLALGDDPLAYEGYARDVVENGPLMKIGAEVGKGQPYYYYPMYSYAIAAAHVLLGEDFTAVTFLNALSVASIVLFAWHLGWRVLPSWLGAAAALALGLFAWIHLLPYTVTAFSDNLFVSLVFIALLVAERAVRTDRPLLWLVAGIAAAPACATRPSLLIFIGVFALAVVGFGSHPSWRRRAAAVGQFSLGFFLGISPFTLRNWIMSRKLVLLVNSWIMIPHFLYPWTFRDPVPPVAISLWEALRVAGSICVTRPLMVVEMETRKVLFTLGFTTAGPPNEVAHPELVLLSALFLLTLFVKRVPRSLGLVLGAFAASHLIAMVLAAPWTYGYKTILPLHAVFLFGSAFLFVKAPTEASS